MARRPHSAEHLFDASIDPPGNAAWLAKLKAMPFEGRHAELLAKGASRPMRYATPLGALKAAKLKHGAAYLPPAPSVAKPGERALAQGSRPRLGPCSVRTCRKLGTPGRRCLTCRRGFHEVPAR